MKIWGVPLNFFPMYSLFYSPKLNEFRLYGILAPAPDIVPNFVLISNDITDAKAHRFIQVVHSKYEQPTKEEVLTEYESFS